MTNKFEINIQPKEISNNFNYIIKIVSRIINSGYIIDDWFGNDLCFHFVKNGFDI